MKRQNLTNNPECYIISSELLGKRPETNALRVQAIQAILNTKEYPYKALQGCYAGQTEKSFLVCDISESEALRLASYFDQESILYLSPERSAFLLFTDGRDREPLGNFKPVPRALAAKHSAWTIDPENPNYVYICDGVI